MVPSDSSTQATDTPKDVEQANGDPDQSDPSNDQDESDGEWSERQDYLVIWGQLTAFEDFDVDLYSVVDTDARIFPLLRIGLEPDGSRIGDGQNLNHLDFYENLHFQYPSDQEYKFEERVGMIQNTLIQTLGHSERLQDLTETISGEEPQTLDSTLSTLIETTLFTKDEASWLKATRASESDFVQSEGGLPDEWNSDELNDADVIEVDGEIQPIQTLPQVSILTSVISGVSAEELSPGDEIRVRLKVNASSDLPETFQDPKRDNLSTPVNAEVLEIIENPSLPFGISGRNSSYRGIVVRCFNDFLGIGTINDDEHVQLIDNDPLSRNTEPYLSSRELIGIVVALILLICFLIL